MTPREYLMCAPEHFAVEYVINPWMRAGGTVDVELAVKQWTRLREVLAELGHRVHVLDPEPGLPDMVFAANGAFSVGGTVYGARFRYPQREGEALRHRDWYRHDPGWRYVEAAEVNEGEGDFAYVPGARGTLPDTAEVHLAGGTRAGLVLAGYGFRTAVEAHAEAAVVLGRPVISLNLVDPRFYHLDTALAVLDDDRIAYYPDAFSPSSRAVLAALFPDAVIATEDDGLAFGLNLVSDGTHVLLNAEATALAGTLAAAGYRPIPIELGELKKAGGSVKCCVAELRR